jgi:hypothetical protein
MYLNGKMKPFETIPGMGGKGIKENDGGVYSTMIHCKNFSKCHIVPPSTTIIKRPLYEDNINIYLCILLMLL